MKILHVITFLKIGGAQRLLSDVLPLVAKKHHVVLLVNRGLDNDFAHKIQDAGINIETIGVEDFFSIRNLFALRKKMKGYDIVHVHLFPLVYWAALASLFCKVNLVYTEHSTYNKRREKWYLRGVERFVYGRYKRIISISNQTQAALMDWLRVKSFDKRFVVVNNGVDISSFGHIQRNLDYPHALIMVSRFVESKDQKTVIRAVAKLSEDIHVIFVGDGERLDECKLAAHNLGISHRVHFVGKQSDVKKWLGKADLGIQSSNWEGFGLTAVELMAAGLPVIASDVDGLKQVVEGAGLLFAHGDADELAVKIKLVYSDKNLYSRLAVQCLERCKQFDIQKTADEYLKLYDKVLNNE